MLTPFPSATAFALALGARLTLRGLTLRRNPWTFGDSVSHAVYRYSCQHSHFRCLHRRSRGGFTGLRNAPLPRSEDRNQKSVIRTVATQAPEHPGDLPELARPAHAARWRETQAWRDVPPATTGRRAETPRDPRARSTHSLIPFILVSAVLISDFCLLNIRSFGARLQPRYIFGAGPLIDQ